MDTERFFLTGLVLILLVSIFIMALRINQLDEATEKLENKVSEMNRTVRTYRLKFVNKPDGTVEMRQVLIPKGRVSDIKNVTE